MAHHSGARRICNQTWEELISHMSERTVTVYEFVLTERQLRTYEFNNQFAFVIDAEGQVYGCEAETYGMGYLHRQKSLTAIMSEELRLMCVEFCMNLSRDFVNGLKHRFKNDVTIRSGVNTVNSRTRSARGQRRILAIEIHDINVAVDAVHEEFCVGLIGEIWRS